VPAASEFDLKVLRSDLDPTPGQLTTQIIKGIIESRAVVADVTGRNPNVFFELGVAQAFAKPLALLVKSSDASPFDIKNERMIVIGDGDILGPRELVAIADVSGISSSMADWAHQQVAKASEVESRRRRHADDEEPF